MKIGDKVKVDFENEIIGEIVWISSDRSVAGLLVEGDIRILTCATERLEVIEEQDENRR